MRYIISFLLAVFACYGESKRVQTYLPSTPTDKREEVPVQSVPLPKNVLVKKGSISLIITNAKEAEAKIIQLLQTYGGYVEAKESHAYVKHGELLTGSEVHSIVFRIKVDAKKFDEFIEKVKEIGSYTHEEISIEDVTFQYADLSARLSNQRKLEESLLKHLDDLNKDYKVILEIEKELSRVREQIEQLTSQMRILENQIAYSTLVIRLEVKPEWVPPEDRDFAGQVYQTLVESLSAMATVVKTLAILFIAALPWLVIIGVIAFLIISFIRGKLKKVHKG